MAGGLDRATGKRQWVYPLKVKGRFQRLHRWSGGALQAVLFLLPWVTWDGHPLLLADLPGRRLFVFGAIFTPRDTFLLVLLGLMAAFGLFFATTLFGRLWCGYGCPQTVFLEEWIRPLEELFEGSRGKRMHRDRGPWTAERIVRKTGKMLAFGAVSAVVALSFTSFFVPARVLWVGDASLGAYGVAGFIGALLFLDFAWFREQFCNYICPYARFQGALTDEQSWVVAYDIPAGEPRGKRSDPAATGACTDCGKCSAACPQGIDIRDGYQLECVNCARCIDACEGVMGKKGLPGLIRNTTAAQEAGQKQRWFRGRSIAYGVLLSGLFLVFIVVLQGRHEVEATVNRAPGSLYTVDDDGWVRNTFLLHVTNNQAGSTEASTFTVSVEGLDGVDVVMPPVSLAPTESSRVPLVLRVPAATVAGARTLPVRITVTSAFDEVVVETTFKSGTRMEG
jgi:cytochrome c oxidase accessory protein FixG